MNAEVAAALIGGGAGALMGALFGAIATNVVNKLSEGRGDRKALIQSFRLGVNAMRVDAAMYWDSSGRNEQSESEIKRHFHRVLALIDDLRISSTSIDIDKANQLNDEFWEVATGDGFESVNRLADPARVGRLATIAYQLSSVFK